MTDVLPTLVFLCVHNAGRSQMAAGFARALGGKRVQVFSGGSAPAAAVNPVAMEAMREAGIDLSRARPQPWTIEAIRAADVVVTMGCGDECPYVPGVQYEDWQARRSLRAHHRGGAGDPRRHSGARRAPAGAARSDRTALTDGTTAPGGKARRQQIMTKQCAVPLRLEGYHTGAYPCGWRWCW